jgi:hypothetical protein
MTCCVRYLCSCDPYDDLQSLNVWAGATLSMEPSFLRTLLKLLKNDMVDDVCVFAVSNDVYGVFARGDLNNGERLLIDSGNICATRASNRRDSCGPFCRPGCASAARASYHDAGCRKDFYFLNTAANGARLKSSGLDNVLILRVLAASLHEGVQNPLRSKFLRRLTPQYERVCPDTACSTPAVSRTSALGLLMRAAVLLCLRRAE